MKKVLMLLISAMLVLSMVGAVSAEATGLPINQDDTDKTGDVDVTLTLKELYKVTLPASFSVELNTAGTEFSGKSELAVDITRLNVGNELEIAVKSKYGDTLDGNPKWYLVEMTEVDGGSYVRDHGSDAKKLEYRLGYGGGGDHIDGSATEIFRVGSDNNEGYSKVLTTTTDIDTKFIHAKLQMPAAEIDSAVFQDTLEFRIKIIPQQTQNGQ